MADKKDADEMMASFEASRENMAGNTPSSNVKKELVEDQGEQLATMQEEEEEENKTLAWLKEKPKTVLRQTAEVITNLKEMFQVTAGAKYCDCLHSEIAKLTPKFAKMYKSVESIVVKSEGEVTEAALMVVAQKLDEGQQEYEEIRSAYVRFFPKTKKPKVV